MQITTKGLFAMSLYQIKRAIVVFWLRRRVNYWKKQRAFSIEAQSQERSRQRRIEDKLIACRADLSLMERS